MKPKKVVRDVTEKVIQDGWLDRNALNRFLLLNPSTDLVIRGPFSTTRKDWTK